jgi:hypothetical protein
LPLCSQRFEGASIKRDEGCLLSQIMGVRILCLLNRVWIQFKPERLSNYCNSCRKIGHTQFLYVLRNKTANLVWEIRPELRADSNQPNKM